MLDMIVDAATHAALPDAVRAEYNERDGSYELDVSGAYSKIDRDKLQGSLAAERGEHKTTRDRLTAFGDQKPENGQIVWDALIEANTKLETAPGTGDIEEAANRISAGRVEAATRPLQRIIDTITGERDTAVKRGDGLQAGIDQKTVAGAVLHDFALKSVGGITDAHPDVILWATTTFELNETGETVARSDIQGVTPGLSPKEVFTDMLSNGQRKHWFGTSTSADAKNGKGGDLTNNPFALVKETGRVANLTACTQLILKDKATAQRMCLAAGAKQHFESLFIEK